MNTIDTLQPILSNALQGKTPVASGHMSDATLHNACNDFEALVVGNLMATMRESVPDDGLIPHGQGEKIFQEMLDNEYAKQISKTDSLGLAAMLYRQLSASGATNAALPTPEKNN